VVVRRADSHLLLLASLFAASQDHYKILGVETDASEIQIKKA